MLSNRLAKHFGAAAAAAVVVGSANAAIVWSGLVNIEIASTTNGLYLNVITGANNMPGSTGGATVPGWDINPWSSTGLSFFNPSNPTGGVYVRTSAAVAGVSNLAAGTEIGATSLYTAGAAQTTGTNPFNLNSSSNIVGFRFFNEASSTIHYGWFRVSLAGTLSAQPRTLVEYAYESQAGVSIQAGAIPAPGAIALLGLAGLAGRRRR
ncbi:MAG: hypothetical protein GC172_00205 [Phycisphaera sp.]|nr:hypothetical protein [Phycisphaera sp.]